jgi:hypothetical protein
MRDASVPRNPGYQYRCAHTTSEVDATTNRRTASLSIVALSDQGRADPPLLVPRPRRQSRVSRVAQMDLRNRLRFGRGSNTAITLVR